MNGDITKQDTDCIVSVIPQNLEYRGSLNAAILEAAGGKLDEFVLENIFKPRPCDIYAVPGFDLPCKHILFAILPKWRSDFDRDERHLLTICRKAMEITRAMCLTSISFPALATGRGGYPAPKAARLIIQAVTERLDESFTEVRLVSPDENKWKAFHERLTALGWEEQ